MVDASKIKGKKLNELLNYLIQNKTILSVRLIGTEYERLTYLMCIEQDLADSHLIIDLPEGFYGTVRDASPWRLGFNFNGPDNLEYIFEVTGGEFHPNGLRIPCPEFVERIQRRKNFRIMSPAGTRMVVTTEAFKGLLNLINISLSGAYGVIAKHNLKHRHEPILEIGQTIDKAGIIFPADNEMDEQIIVIREAVVRRIDHQPGTRKYKYAFEFSAIGADQTRKLTQAIYHLQRQFLVRR